MVVWLSKCVYVLYVRWSANSNSFCTELHLIRVVVCQKRRDDSRTNLVHLKEKMHKLFNVFRFSIRTTEFLKHPLCICFPCPLYQGRDISIFLRPFFMTSCRPLWLSRIHLGVPMCYLVDSGRTFQLSLKLFISPSRGHRDVIIHVPFAFPVPRP